MKQKNVFRMILLAFPVLYAGGAVAAGFQLQSQNAAGTGYAYAGVAAVAEDASTIFFNPAGLTYLPAGRSVSVGGAYLHRSLKYSDTGTTPMPVINPLNGMPTGAFHPIGNGRGEGGGQSLLPSMFYAQSLSPDLWVGLGLTVTYGSETEYDPNFAGRFSGHYTSIHQINLNPTLAWRLNDRVSLGFGLNFAKSDVEFRQTTPFVGAPDGKLSGDDTAWGWNAGLMFQLSPDTRVGVTYRSTMKFDLEGRQQIGAPLNIGRDITARLETPDNFSLALHQRVNDRLVLLADATWTGWSSVKALTAVYPDGSRAAAPLRYNYKDSWRFGLGGMYQLDPAWSLRAGVAYDKTPVPDAQSRTLTVPDSDRIWLAFGARWTVSDSMSLDFGYAHIFFKDSSIERAVKDTSERVTLQTVRGDFDTSADVLAVQMNYRF